MVFQALAEPHRRTILQMVAQQELSAGEIAQHFAITRPAVSQHLAVLKEAGLVSERREGTRRLYRARTEGLEEARAFLEALGCSFVAAKRAVEQAERRKR